MKLKIYSTVFCIFLISALTGCQLAMEDAGSSLVEDKLVGVFVTTEYLDLFDLEGYLNDNLKGFHGGNITVDGNTEKYQGRLYATQTTKTFTSEETGDTSESEDYVFPIDGIPYFSATVPAKGSDDSYLTSISDPAISEGHIDYNVGNDANSVTLKGTVYVSITGVVHSFY